MFDVAKFVCILLIFECIQLNLATNEELEQTCLKKFNTTKSKPIDKSDIIETIKHRCSMICIDPEHTKSPPGYEQLCVSVENTQENNEKLQMCLNKYNPSSKSSKSSDLIAKTKLGCLVKCISSNAVETVLREDNAFNTANLDAQCHILEDNPENNLMQETCLNKYNVTKDVTFSIAKPMEMAKVLCSWKCIMSSSPDLEDLNQKVLKDALSKMSSLYPGFRPEVFGNQTVHDQICQSLEMSPENTKKHQKCFNECFAPDWLAHGFGPGPKSKPDCAVHCVSPDLFTLYIHMRDLIINRLYFPGRRSSRTTTSTTLPPTNEIQ